MKTDLYTKFVLSVIAASLVTMILRDIQPIASAQAQDRLPAATPENVVWIAGWLKKDGTKVLVAEQGLPTQRNE